MDTVITDIEHALSVLRDSLCSDSPETRRKAAMDILALHGVTERDKPKPTVTEEQLNVIGRVLIETEEVSRLPIDGEDRALGSIAVSG